MPVLINRDTGAAEELAHELASSAVQSTHDIPMLDPQGNDVIAPFESAASLLQQGYTQPNSEQLKGLLDYTKFSSAAEQAKTFAEGAGSGATMGLSTLAERAAGVNPEDINMRREVNPIAHVAGEVAGFGASMLTPIGAGALIGRAGAKAGALAAERLGAGALSRIGSTSAKFAAENALFTTGSEISKLAASDPHQSLETAVGNIGMSGLLGMAGGAAFKGTGELWAIGPGKQLTQMMQAIANKAEGLPSELKLASGIDLAPEVEAALTKNPLAQRAFQTLQESNTKSGIAAQESLTKFYQDVNGALSNTIGKTPDDIIALGSSSRAEVGRSFQDSLAKSIDDKIKPISEQYEKFQSKFASAEISPTQKVTLANDIAEMITNQGLDKGPNEAGLRLAQKTIQQLSKQATAQDLRAYAQGLAQVAPYGSETYQVGKELRKILNSGMQSTVESKMLANSPQLLEQYKATNSQYSQFRDLLSELNDRLHLGREGKSGAEGFISGLKSADPETVASRLSLKGDVNLQALLSQQFPEAAALARSHELNAVVKASLDKSGEALDPKKFFKNFNKLEPELKNYLVSSEGLAQISALEQLVNKVPSKMNTSGTARTLDALWNRVPESAAALIALMTGHNPIVGYFTGKAASYIGKEVPDAVRLTMLKFLGGDGKVSAAGFKATAKMASAIMKGESALTGAAEDVFGIGAKVIRMPEMKNIDKLKDVIDKVAVDPGSIMQDDNKLAHYTPDHAVALGMINGRAIAYLAGLRPVTAPAAPMDPERKPSKIEENNYKQALLIAEQPLSVLKSIKEGSLTIQDVQHLHNLYPALLGRMQVKMTEAMTKAISQGKTIPYKTKISASMFMGQPLESSLKPENIMAAQPMPTMQQAQSMPASKSSKIMKLPQTYSTPDQNREMYRQGKQ